MQTMDDVENNTDDTEEGAPAWVMTFADLMSLLMCFFVLLLSFSEMDVQKFKQIAGSMKHAFGVQRDVQFKMIPKGTSIVAQEFSPGKPTPTPLKEMRQSTTDETKNNLNFTDSNSKKLTKEAAEQIQKEAEKRMQAQAKALADTLEKELKRGLLEIETVKDEIVLRIREKGSFPSGSAKLQKSFYPVLRKIGKALNEVEGRIVVAGHTDNVPISTRKYSSNWLLSAARSATVVHHLIKIGKLTSSRVQIRAHAENEPIAPNNSNQNRAKNRRVEIIVKSDVSLPIDPMTLTQAGALN